MNIVITVERDGDYFIASSEWPLVHGDGDTFALALQDYAECVQELADLIARGAKEGDPYDQAELPRLCEWGFITGT